MSFEGFYLKRCENSHIFQIDVYNNECSTCPECNKPFIKSKLVDTTNGLTEKQYRKIFNKFKKQKI